MQPLTVAFFGISGSGKGTQADLLEKYLREHDRAHGIVRPEMGNLLRKFMKTGTSLAKHTEHILAAGQLVPSFLPIYLLTVTLNDSFDGTQHVILDGTCRRPDQSRAANDMMRLWGRDNLHALVLNLPKEDAKERLVLRGRYDDAKDEIINSRFAWYEENVVPAIETLRECKWVVHDIDGSVGIEQIHKNIIAALGL